MAGKALVGAKLSDDTLVGVRAYAEANRITVSKAVDELLWFMLRHTAGSDQVSYMELRVQLMQELADVTRSRVSRRKPERPAVSSAADVFDQPSALPSAATPAQQVPTGMSQVAANAATGSAGGSVSSSASLSAKPSGMSSRQWKRLQHERAKGVTG